MKIENFGVFYLVILFIFFLSCHKEKCSVIDRYKNGEKKIVECMSNDANHSLIVSYFENGQIESEIHTVKGTLEGKLTNYYENGTIKSLLNLEGGELNGKCLYFFPNEKLESECNYKNGKNGICIH